MQEVAGKMLTTRRGRDSGKRRAAAGREGWSRGEKQPWKRDDLEVEAMNLGLEGREKKQNYEKC